ncbi:CoA transferase [Pseudonocardia zijingensis]|uniref:Crotonobetainyl-CoA:carnitine CoA-transferase CaiB-like acyl-CoA transferase n=1 Tax=Pseudonocardia zijingensis TaxID=153376 RepID=A0ABN1Q150_9PSEU
MAVENPTPLRGLRVVELTDGVAGALTGELLALLGADVVKVEPPAGGRERTLPDGRTNPRFLVANLGKRSVVADGATPAGRAAVVRLIQEADVLVDNLEQDLPSRYGLHAADVAERYPTLIHLSIIGFDPDLPFADVPPTEAVLQCLSGIASITGEPDRPPQRVGPDAAFQATALYGAIGVLAAVLQRARTGRGQRLELSMLDAAINLSRTHFSRSTESGRFHERPGNRQPAAQAEPTGVFPAAGGGRDDFVFAHASPEHLWRRLLRLIEREDLLDDPRFADGPTRLRHRDETHRVVDDWTARHAPDEILQAWGPAGIPVGTTMTTQDLLDDPTLVANGQFADVDAPDWGVVRVPTLPYAFGDRGVPVPSPAPRLGQHTTDTTARPWSSPRLPIPAPAAPDGLPALAGIRVLDFTQALAGPTATQVLALLGADVVRIQRPGAPSLGIERPWLKLQQLSMNKKSVLLDLKSPEGQAAVRGLVPLFDVVMENFAPGTMARLGFDWPDLVALNPSVVFGQIKGFGPGSPFSDFLAFDNIAEAMGTACSLTGDADGEPMLPGPHLGDIGTGLAAALGVLAMLCARLSTGTGGRIAASMQGTVATIFSRLAFAENVRTGAAPTRNGFGDLGAQLAPADVFPCAGGGPNDHCYVSAADEPQWRALVAAMGRPDLAVDDRFASPAARWAHRAELATEIARWTVGFDKHTLMRRLTEAGVTAAAVLDTAELIDDPVLRRRGVFAPVPHPDRGVVFHVHWPIRMPDSFVPMRPAPRLGEHSTEVLAAVGG